ncbi:hypothetical protein BO78DRAFT_372434 [Aspergillus sclerotiicarbonarius CBS 121057]|uniref:Rhodopsin domain-containing protein n=1 Tax=Aspergillus sclerotiicarbonarius (strain CBS 121057 / IBT 28362) TaxID=1448318 RepID=A0A319E3V1_ASPSB|nr:hypothetical protein BO78DRAFT_372434 [Aspergillus sclerotiicarbonarius CBS 121057]
MAYTRGEMIALGFVLLFLPTVFVALRIWARITCHAGLHWDDYTVFCGLAFAISVCICHLIAAIQGQLGQHQTTYPDGSPILDDPRFLIYERCKFALHMLSTLGLGFTKTSMILLYLRIFRTPLFRRICQGCVVFVICWTISFTFACLFQCYPVTALVEFFYGNKCINTLVFYNVLSGSDVALDVVIIILPIAPVLGIQMSLRQRLAVLGMFLLGGLAVACSIARLVSFVECDHTLVTHYNDETYYTSGVFIWTVVELAVAIMCACMPTLRPLFILNRKKTLSDYPSDYRSHPSRRSGYFRSTTGTTDELEIPVLAARDTSGVQIHIQRSTSAQEHEHPNNGVILVQHSTTWTDTDCLARDQKTEMC